MKCFYNNQLAVYFLQQFVANVQNTQRKKQDIDIFCLCRRPYIPKTQNSYVKMKYVNENEICENEPNLTFLTLKMTFKVFQYKICLFTVY